LAIILVHLVSAYRDRASSRSHRPPSESQ